MVEKNFISADEDARPRDNAEAEKRGDAATFDRVLNRTVSRVLKILVTLGRKPFVNVARKIPTGIILPPLQLRNCKRRIYDDKPSIHTGLDPLGAGRS